MKTAFIIICAFATTVDAFAQQQPRPAMDTFSIVRQSITGDLKFAYLYSGISATRIASIKRYITERGCFWVVRDANGKRTRDTFTISSQDLDTIFSQLDALHAFNWTANDALRLGFDSNYLLKPETAITDSVQHGHKFEIAPPILFGNNQYCLSYSGYILGGFFSGGHLTFYKYIDGTWFNWCRIFMRKL